MSTQTRPAPTLVDHGWVNVVLAAMAMTATLPGRTHGLGLITEKLLDDFTIARHDYSVMNFWATLLGAAMAWPIGRLVDRLGTRSIGTLVLLGLGASVVGMSRSGADTLFLFLVLLRGLGQGALSIVSMAMVSKWFERRLGPAMGVFSVLLAIGFIAATLSVQAAVAADGWRSAWMQLGIAVLMLSGLTLLLVRSVPDRDANPDEFPAAVAPAFDDDERRPPPSDATAPEAWRMPGFWIFSLGAALFNLVWSAVTLYAEATLSDRGLADEFPIVMAILAGFGLLCNLLGGWLAMRWPIGRLLGLSMLLLAAALGSFPWIASRPAAFAYALAMGGSGGLITVVFFTYYGQAFGRTHLGRIQGSAQILSIFGSAIGPELLTWCHAQTGRYDAFFLTMAPILVVVAIAGWLVSVARK